MFKVLLLLLLRLLLLTTIAIAITISHCPAYCIAVLPLRLVLLPVLLVVEKVPINTIPLNGDTF